jgi:N12 class adenine-specific DNA methylase
VADWRDSIVKFLEQRAPTAASLDAITPPPAVDDWRGGAMGFLRQREAMADIPPPQPSHELTPPPVPSPPAIPRMEPIPSHEPQYYLSELAVQSGAQPDPVTGRLPSDFKLRGHPNEFAGGFSTRTRERHPALPRGDYQDLLDVGWSPEAAAELAATPEPPRPATPMVAHGVTTAVGPPAVWKPTHEALAALATRTPTPFNPPRFAGLEPIIMGVRVGAPTMAAGVEQALVAAQQSPMSFAEKRTPGVGPLKLPTIKPKAPPPPSDLEGPLGLADFLASLTTATPGAGGMPSEAPFAMHPEVELPRTSLSAEGVSKLPFIGSIPAIAEGYNLIRAARRVRDGKNTEADNQVLDNYIAKEAEARRRGTSILYDIANVASQIPAFGVEFMATGGFFTGAKALVTEAVVKRLATSGATTAAERAAERFATKAVGYTAGALAQTAVLPHRILAEAARRQAPTTDEAAGGADALRDWDDDFVPALAKAIPDQFVEIFSERTGGLVEGVGGKLAKLPVANRIVALKEAVLSRWLQLHPDRGVRDFFDQVRTKSGWNGIIGEMFEERVGEVMRAAQPYLREPGQPQPAMLRMVTGEPTAETVHGESARAQAMREFGRQLVVEAAAFAVPGTVRGLAELATSGRPPREPGPEPVPMVGRELHVPPAGRQQQPPRGPAAAPPSPPPPPSSAAVAPPVAATPGPPAAEPPTAEEKAAAKAEMKRRMQEAGLLPPDVVPQEKPDAVQEPSAAPPDAREAPEDRGAVGPGVRAPEAPPAARQAEGPAAEEVAEPTTPAGEPGRFTKGQEVEVLDFDGEWKKTDVLEDTDAEGRTKVQHPSLVMQPMWPPGARSYRETMRAKPHQIRVVGGEAPAEVAEAEEPAPVKPAEFAVGTRVTFKSVIDQRPGEASYTRTGEVVGVAGKWVRVRVRDVHTRNSPGGQALYELLPGQLTNAEASVTEEVAPSAPSSAPPPTSTGMLASDGTWYEGPKAGVRRTVAGNYELKFPGKPAPNVLDGLKKAGWRWSPPSKVWYHKPGPGVEDTVYNVTGVQRPRKTETAPVERGPAIDQIISKGAAADQFEPGDAVTYNGKPYTVGKPARRGDLLTLRDADGLAMGVDARDVTRQETKAEAPAVTFTKATIIPTREGVKTEVTEVGGFKVGDHVTGFEGSGIITQIRTEDPPAARLMLDSTKTYGKWTNLSGLERIEPTVSREEEESKAPVAKHVPSPASTRPNFEHFETSDKGLEDDIKGLLNSQTNVGLTKYEQDDLASMEAELGWRENTLVYDSATNEALHDLLTHIESWDKNADATSQKGRELLEAEGQIIIDVLGHSYVRAYHAAVDVMTQDELSFASALLEGHLGVELEPSTELDRAITRLRRDALEAAGQQRIDFEKAEEPAKPAEFKPPTTAQTKAAPTKYEATKAALDAEEAAILAKIRAKMNQLNVGIDPEMAGLAVQLLGVYARKGINEFGEAVRQAIDQLGRPTVERMAIYLDAGWSLLHPEAEEVSTHQVLTTLPAEPTVQEEGTDAASTTGAGVRGRPAVEAGVTGQPPGGPRAEGAEGVAGEQPAAAEAAPAAGGQAEGGAGRPRGGRRGPRRGGADVGGGRQPSPGERAGDASDVDTADDVDDPNVVTAHARGERPKHFRISDVEELTTGGSWIGKLENNMAALRLLKQLDAQKRPATADEQAVLAKYIGWGHTNLAPVVASKKAADLAGKDPRLGKAREELERLLTPAELKDLGESVINAHYSFSDIPRALWSLAERLGFKGGRILEPAIGTGHFFGTMPPAIVEHPRTVLFGVDKEPVAAAIAQQLYQGAIVQASPLEEARVPDEFYDFVISNVPFGKVEVFDPAFVSPARALMTRSIHNYYFGKALDAVRPGGLVIFVTSRYTMDSQNDSVRAYIADRAHFLGAFRMPSSAFKTTAGTEVVTDVIVLQKKEPGATLAQGIPGWIESVKREDLGKEWNEDKGRDEFIHTNEYFVAHPENILGEEDRSGKMNYRATGYNVTGVMTPDDLARVVDSFPKNTYKATLRPDRRKFAKDVPLDSKNGSYVMDGKHIAVYNNGTTERVPLTGKTAARVKAFIPLRDAYQVVLDAMTTGQDDATLKAAQAELRKTYEAFVAGFGRIALTENKRAIKADPNASRIITLEVTETYSEKDASGRKKRVVDFIGLADIFSKRVVDKVEEPTKAASPQDALVQSLAWKGHVDLEYMAGLLESTPDAVTKGLTGELFFEPKTKVWVTREEYLSGDVVTKLEQAQFAAELDPAFKPNVEALEKVQPAPKTPETFEAPFGATWVPDDIYESFLRAVGNTSSLTVKLSNNEHRTEFHVDGFGGTHEFMPEGTNFVEWAYEALNNRLPRIYNEEKVDGETIKIFSQEKTDQYRESLKQLREQWALWWKNNDKAAETLTNIYNALLNREVPRKFDGSRILIVGANPELRWHPWQKNVVWRTLQGGNTMIAHAVGAGKTFAGIAIAGEWKRLGLARKPMIVVPNHLVEQWRADFQYVYPGARVLVPDESDFQKDRRQELIARITNQDWDAIVMAQSQYLRISVKLATLKAFIQQQEDELIANGAEQADVSREDFKDQVDAKEAGKKGLFGRGTTASVKDIVRAILNLRARLRKRLDQQKKSSPVTFEELGVDGLIVDEAHMFKNLYFSTGKNDIVGLKGSDAARSMDMFLKARYLNEQSKSRNLVFMTGTPVTNTMSEVYTVFRYLAQPQLADVGMAGFDAWANAFAVAAPESEPKPGGGYKERTRLRYWVNLRELTGLFWRFADVFTTQQLIEAKNPDGTPVVTLPAIKNGRPTVITTPPPPGHEEFMAEIRDRLEALKGGKVDPKDDNHLKIYTQASLEAIDMRLIDPEAPENPQGRLVAAADKIADIYRASQDDLGTQLVFLNAGAPRTVEPLNLGGQRVEAFDDADKMVVDEDQGEIVTDEEEEQTVLDAVASLETGRDLYKDLKRKLIAKGIKPQEIAFIHQAPEPGDKIRLFRAVREGRVRVLIGTGAKMGTGMNVQTRVVAVHELDAPWRPDWLEQQEARGIRQGNTNKEVEIVRYVTKGSFEEYRWGLLATKQDFLTKFYRGELDSMEDLDPAQMDQKTAAALASGNPDALTLVHKDRELRSLRGRRVNFLQRQRKARRAIDSGDAEAKRDEERIAQNDADLAVLDEWAKKPTAIITHNPSRFYLEELDTPLTFDLKDTDARKAFQAKLEAILQSGYASYRSDPVVVGRVGPYVLVIQAYGRDEFKVVNGEPTTDRIQIQAPQLFLSNDTTIGEKRRGPLRTVLPFASLPEWDEKVPPDYRRSLDAHTKREALEKLGGFSRKSLAQWAEDRKGHLEVLGKQFGQDAELEALEAEVRRLRVSVGQDEAPETPGREPAAEEPPSDEDDEDAMPMGGGAPRRHMMPLPARSALPTRASAPGPAGPQMNRDEILAAFQKFFADVPMSVRRFQQRAGGIYKPDVWAIRTKVSKDLQVILHELGHHVDKAVMQIRPARAAGANRAVAVELEALGEVTTPPSKLKDRQYKRKEGAAEYLRLWFTEPEAAATQAPAFTALFEAYLNSDKALGAFFREQQAQIQGLLAMTPEQELEERIDWNGEPGRWSRFRDWVLGTTSDPRDALQKLNDALNDDNLPILRVEQAMEKGLPVKDYGSSAYVAFRTLAGTSGEAQTFLEDHIRRADGTIMGPGFLTAVREVLNRKDYRPFVAYLVARRAQEYHEQGLETGIRPSTVEAAMAAEVPERFVTAAERVTAYWDTLLQWAVEHDYLSRDSAEAMRARNTRYVPWERVMDAADAAFRGPGTKKQNTPQAIKARTGSARRIVDPIVTSIKNTFTFVRTVEENTARLKLVDLIHDEGGARFLERVSMKQVATRFNLDRVRSAILAVLAANGVTVGEEIPNDIEFDALVTVFTPAIIAQGDARIVTVLRDGKREWYEVHDDAIWELLVNAQPQQPRNWITKFAVGAASLLRRAATSTLSFAMRNPIRDTIDAKTKAAYHHSFLKTLAAAGLIIKNDESWQRFRAAKAAQASIVAVDRDYAKNEIKKFQHGRLRRTLDKTVFNPFEGLRALAELSDNATRLQAFRETEKKLAAQGIGGAEREARAAFTARESTQDFAKMGSVVRRYNRYEAFLGARIGGWTRIATELGDPDKRAAYAFKAFLYGLLPGLLLWLLNREDPEYRELAGWERAAFWHIPNGRGGWVRIPRPFDVGDIGNVLETYLDWAVDNDPEAIQRLPFAGVGDADLLKAFLALAPTAVLPVLEAAANYDTFRKRPIVSPFDLDLPLEQQYSQWTSTFSKQVGPAIGLAPAMLDHIIYGYTSATGQFISSLVSKAEEKAGWAPPSASRGLRDVPGIGAFVGQKATGQATSLERFRQRKASLEQYSRMVNRYVREGQIPKAQALLTKNAKAAQELSGLRRADAQIRLVTQQIRLVRQRFDLTPAEKREIYDRLYDAVIDMARYANGEASLPERHPPVSPGLLVKVPSTMHGWVTKPRLTRAAEPAAEGGR